MKKIGIALSFCAVALLACAQPTSTEGVREVKNLSYLPAAEIVVDSLQRLNLVLPENVKDFPLLIWIGGGAWSYVDRHVEMDLARKLAKAGIGVASIGHRLSPATWRDSSLTAGIQHPKHVEDVAAATKWLYDNAATYGYDTSKFFIGGFSSGAHLAALLSMDGRYLQAIGLSEQIFRGVIPISGTYDIPHYYEVLSSGGRPELGDLHVKAVFGQTNDDFLHASPVQYLANLRTPMLILTDHPLRGYTRRFEDRLLETEYRAFQVVYVHDLSHAELWRNLSFAENSVYREMLIGFIRNS